MSWRPNPSLALGAAALTIAAGLAAWSWPSSAAQRAAESSAIGRQVSDLLDEAAAALHSRLGALAALPRLAAAVSTDAQTVRDLSQDELAFRPQQPGETIAIAQLTRGGATGARKGEREAPAVPVILMLVPDSGEVPPLDVFGARLFVRRGRLVMSDALRVIPRERADQIDGVVAATRPVDLDAISARLVQRGIAGWLKLGLDLPLPVGLATREAPGSGEEIDVASTAGGLRLELRLPSPARSGGAAWYSAIALGLLGIALALRGIFSRAAAPAIPERGYASHAAATPGRSAAAPHPEPPRGPKRVGRYNLMKRLGTGGMAEVYLGRLDGEAGFSKLFAVKVLQPSFARQPIVVEHFLDEARLASRLDHPNVVQVLDLGSADGEFFIAMEFVDGADLFRVIELHQRLQRRIPIPIALGILRRICDGLQAAHTMRTPDGRPLDLVHRDVKSANVFVSKDGAVKIGDFGIAKANDVVRVGRTEVGMVKGTPGYMAPEQRMSQAVDAGADLYGVGAIAYELVSGAPINLDLAVLAQKGTVGWPHLRPLSDFRDDIPPELTALVFRALAFDRQDRFADCADLEAALAELANRYSASAGIEKSIGRWMTETLAASVVDPDVEELEEEAEEQGQSSAAWSLAHSRRFRKR